MIPAATAAFDRLAPDYDALVSGEAFQQQRRQTQAVFARWIRPGFRVLEIGCGTGLDTEFLAARGARVIACDPSEAMLSRARRRVAAAGLGDRVELLVCGLQDLPRFLEALHRDDRSTGARPAKVDAIVSNFGALNCAPSLEPLGVLGGRHLCPGGVILVGLIGRTCLWEMLYFTARGEAANARRRRAAGVAVPVGGVDVPTFYHRTADVRACLGGAFTRHVSIGIGVAVPPPYLEPRWRRLPRLLRRAAAGADRAMGSWPLVNRLGDHTLTCWVKSRVAHD